MRPPSAPKIPPGVRRLFRLPWSRARMIRELDDEVRFHLEMREAALRERGLTEAEAQAEARRRFGDADELREYCANVDARRARRARMLAWLGAWMQDVRFALRQFRKTPAFTAIAILTLALGIGANTAIFTVVHRLLLAPLPYPDGNRIVKLVMGDAFASTPNRSAQRIWQARAHSLEMIAGVGIDAILVDSREEQDTVHAFITSNYLRLLGIHPVLGREFTPEDERPGGAAVAMISYQMWQQTYGGRRDVLGKTIDIDGRPHMIVAVAPRTMGLAMSHPVGFRMQLHEATPGIWLPAPLDKTYDVFAKLRPGVSAQDASRELATLIDTVPGSAQNRAQPRAMRAQDFLDPHEA